MIDLKVDEDGVIGTLCNAPDFGSHYRDALKWMRRPHFLETPRYRTLQWSADRNGAFEPLVAFERGFCARFRKLGIPVHCREFMRTKAKHEELLRRKLIGYPFGKSPHNFGYAVQLVHSVLGSDMPSICWDIFRHVGEELAEQLSLDVEWHGPEFPYQWQMRQWMEWRWNPPVRYDGDPPS